MWNVKINIRRFKGVFLKITITPLRFDIIFCKYPEHQEHKNKEVFCKELLNMYETKMHEINQHK
ncbi:hypothetical protein CYJ36_21440 [Bacillus sp. UMB0893]|nr:hypothetical protein CYJ36_21440 [Bacillus sp. UMB0893]